MSAFGHPLLDISLPQGSPRGSILRCLYPTVSPGGGPAHQSSSSRPPLENLPIGVDVNKFGNNDLISYVATSQVRRRY